MSVTRSDYQSGPRRYVRATATGAAALSERVEVGQASRVLWAGVKFSVAPTSTENLVIAYDSASGAAYDVTLLTYDPSAESATAVSWEPDEAIYLMPGDALSVAYTNTDTTTWGLTVLLEVL